VSPIRAPALIILDEYRAEDRSGSNSFVVFARIAPSAPCSRVRKARRRRPTDISPDPWDLPRMAINSKLLILAGLEGEGGYLLLDVRREPRDG
jgi:hypothetical protein